jgi:hypothetical protein
MPTADECKKIISKLGFKLGVSPNLIATRLLSDDDKGDMMEGNTEISSLEAAVEVWRDNGMPNYAFGRTETYEEEKNKALMQKMFARGQE